MSDAISYSAIATSQKVDAESGIISGVSVISVGECAGKHKGTFIDQTTLEKLLSLAAGFKDGIKTKLSMENEHDGSVGRICGSLKNFRIDGTQLRADLHLLKSDEYFDKIIEMSSKMPESFGLSVVVPNHFEKKDGKQFLRPTDIFSADLVEEPAANKTGLFSAKEPMEKSIKYAKGTDGDHAKDCECKACMSANKKSMSETLCDVLGLTAEDTAETIKTKLAAFAPKPAAPPEIAALSAKLDEVTTKLAAYDKTSAEAALSAKKTEIAGLVADATREGKVVPLSDEELLAMPIPTIKSMFSKLTKGQVKLSGSRHAEPPKGTDGKVIEFKTSEEKLAFCRSKHEEGAQLLQERLSAIFEQDHPNFSATRN